MKIGTDWFVKVKCPKPNKSANNHVEHIKTCSGCPYVIWGEPEMVAGFMASKFGSDLTSYTWPAATAQRYVYNYSGNFVFDKSKD